MTVELPVLYSNHRGEQIRTGSYSARADYVHCPSYFDLKRRQGYSEKISRISMEFGKCIEAGVASFHENNMRKGAAVEMFNTLWERLKGTKDFDDYTFTAKEGTFDELWRKGREMMSLYEVLAPSLPIRLPQFQVKAKKEIFPNTELAGLWNTAYIDILSKPLWYHPMLQPLESEDGIALPRTENIRPLVIDVKTSGVELREDLVALDPQLREYAWQLRIPDVAFLWFQKMGLSISKGDTVSSLLDGKKYIVGGVDKDANGEPATVRVFPSAEAYAGFKQEAEKIFAAKDRTLAIVEEEEAFFDAHIKGLRGKAREAMKLQQAPEREDLEKQRKLIEGRYAEEHDAALAAAGMLVLQIDQVTKQRIQFAAARLTEKDMDDSGRNVGQVSVQMVHSEKTDYFPKTGGIRFPNNPCVFCSMRGICANKPEITEQLLVKAGEEWLEGEAA